MTEKETRIFEMINDAIYKDQRDNRAVRYSVLTKHTLPMIRECLLLAGITSEELSRYDTFISEAMDICKKYMEDDND